MEKAGSLQRRSAACLHLQRRQPSRVAPPPAESGSAGIASISPWSDRAAHIETCGVYEVGMALGLDTDDAEAPQETAPPPASSYSASAPVAPPPAE